MNVSSIRSRIVVFTLLALGAIGAVWMFRNERPPTSGNSAMTPIPPASRPPAANPEVTPDGPGQDRPAANASPVPTFEGFRRQPFAVAQQSPAHAWTAEDGRDGDAILKIAHNEWEVERLLEENARIKRRQLVYRKQPAWKLVEQAKATGQPIRMLTLPAFDGQELEMEVTASDLAPSGMSGTFSGRLTGQDQSLVTLAFKQGTEAFTIQSPQDGTYLQGHPREPGEIILTSFDPATYLPVPGGEPIRTHDSLKQAE